MDRSTKKQRISRPRFWPVGLLAALVLLLAAPAASAATAREEQQGARIVREVESGQARCGDLSGEDFDHIGEYLMGRMFASATSHEAMDEFMSRMMGSGSETRVHEAMGRRFAGCGGGQLPAGFGRMMGALNAMAMMGGGMMGGLGQGQPYGSTGSMMGGRDWNESSAGDDDFGGPSAGAMIGMMAVLIGAVAIAVFVLARRGSRSPLDTLKQRYAGGELSAEEYEERKHLLGGS